MTTKTTSDHRDTRFEIVSLRQFAHGRGGLHMEAIERGTVGNAITTLEISTTHMGPELNAKIVEAFTDLENVFAAVFDEKSRAATPDARHAAVKAVLDAQAKKQSAEEDRQRHEAESAKLAAANAEAAKKLKEQLDAIAKAEADHEAAMKRHTETAKAERDAAAQAIAAKEAAEAALKSANAALAAAQAPGVAK